MRAALLIWALAIAAPYAHAAEPIPADSFSIDDFAGQVVYLDFWASWCVPCRLSFPWMNDMQARYRDQGLRVVAVNLDSDADAASAFLAQHHAGFTVVRDPDGTLAERYGVSGMPNSFVIGRDGRVVKHHEGFRRSDTAELERLLATQLEAHP